MKLFVLSTTAILDVPLVWRCMPSVSWLDLRASLFWFVQIPPNGFAMDGEIDIAVDFIAPPLPGRYMSYWRLASPLGQKFGQRVWVLIQVLFFLPQ